MKPLEKAAFFRPKRTERVSGNKVKAFTNENEVREFIRSFHKKGTFYSLSVFEGEVLHKIMEELQLDLFDLGCGHEVNKLYIVKW